MVFHHSNRIIHFGAYGLLLCMLITTGCSGYGRLSDKYPPEFYRVPKQFSGNSIDKDPTFIIYGDNRPGWRFREVLGRKKTWVTWKHLYLPGIYQLYLIGTGIVGFVNHSILWKPDYGGQEARMVRDAIFKKGTDENIDFIFHTGDMATDGRRFKHWETFLEQNKTDVPLVTEFPFLPVVGNHEEANDSTYGLANYTDVFSYPPFYTFRSPHADFFIIDSNILIDQKDLIEDDVQDRLFEELFVSSGSEPSWLERELTASTKAFKIVLMHHPPLAFGKHHDNWSKPKNGPDLENKRQKLLKLFAEKDVKIVFNGHQHMYERNELAYLDDDGDEKIIQFVVTGGGGSPLDRAYSADEIDKCVSNYDSVGLSARCGIQEIIYNYCLVDIDATRVNIKVFEVSESAETNGRLVEEIIVE